MTVGKRTLWIAVMVAVLAFGAVAIPALRSSDAEDAPGDVVVAAAPHTVRRTLRLSGRVKPRSVADVKSPVSGRLVRFVVGEGDRVRAGAPLAVIEPDQSQALLLEQARVDVRLRKIALDQASRDYERLRQLTSQGIVAVGELERSRQAFDSARESLQLTSAQLQILERQVPRSGDGGTFRLVSPVDGTALARQLSPGESIVSGTSGLGGGTVVIRIADLSSFAIEVDISEADVLDVQPGQAAELRAAGRTARGHVARVGVEGKTEQSLTTYRGEVLPDDPLPLLPGMTCDVDIILALKANTLAVPASAILREAGRAYVLRSGTRTPVTTGLEGDDFVEITRGLRAGDRVSTNPPHGRPR